MNIKSNFKFILLFGIFLVSSIVWTPVLAQIPHENGLSVNINTPANSARVPSGELTIYGTSSDDDTKNCQVYTDWNDLKPMQKVTPDGTKGNRDYSKWSYTYTESYHTIVEGPNELTSKISCYDQGQNASSKFNSINVTGTSGGSATTHDTVQQSDENTNTDKKDANMLPVKDTKTSNTDNTVQQSDENTNTDKKDANMLPVKDTKTGGTYKILPLYSESNEKVTNSESSRDADKAKVTSTDTTESQVQDSMKTVGTADTKTLSSEQQQGSQATANTTESQVQDSMKTDGTADTKTLSSEQPQESQASTDTTESQVQDSMKTDSTADTKTPGPEQQKGSEGTTTYEMSKPHVTERKDKEVSTNTNKYFTFEPNLHEDQKLSDNDNNPMKNKPDSDSSHANHYDEVNSVFGLKMKDLNEDTKNKIDSKLQELKEKLAADHIHMFGMAG